jgi:hypothetical protein
MMEIVSRHTNTIILPAEWPANESSGAPLPMGRSTLPRDAVARIWKPARSQ